MDESTERESFGWRDLFGAVNLRDFFQMVGAELSMIGSLFSRSASALPRLPFGPLVSVAYLLMGILRGGLLVLVVIVFGGAIALISAFRAARRTLSG